MLGYLIWTVYCATLWWWFVDAAIKKEEKSDKPVLDAIMAVLPPLSCSAGAIGYFLFSDSSLYAKCYTAIWALGIVGMAWEFTDIKKAARGTSIPVAAVLGLLALAMTFGPGTYLGYHFIFQMPR